MTSPLEASNKLALLGRWNETKKALAALVLKEKELRAEVVAAFSDTAEDAAGTERFDVGEGYDLKIEKSLNYKLANANDYEQLHKVLDTIEKGEDGRLLAERIVKQKFELSVTEYKRLPGWAKKEIDKVLTISPGSTAIEIVQRKK